MCQLLSCCFSQFQTVHPAVPYSVALGLGLSATFSLVSSLHVGLPCKGAGGTAQLVEGGRTCFLILSQSPSPHLTLAVAVESNSSTRIPLAVSLTLAGSASYNSLRDTGVRQVVPPYRGLGPGHTSCLLPASKF